jgi:hypothetical protein
LRGAVVRHSVDGVVSAKVDIPSGHDGARTNRTANKAAGSDNRARVISVSDSGSGRFTDRKSIGRIA